MRTCTRIIGFDMGHRVFNHEGKCARLHGHRYHAHVTVTANDLDDVGRVVDFGVIKDRLGDWIDKTWDHRTMIFEKDPLSTMIPQDHLVIVAFNPTAENIAQALFDEAHKKLVAYGVTPVAVRLYETPNCYADYSAEISS